MNHRLTLPGLLIALLPSAAAQTSSADLLGVPEWRERGPALFGGRIVDVVLRADDPAALLAASASGGLWRSFNQGTTWECIFQHEGTISIGDVAWDANDPDVIWVGTGEANNQRSSFWGDGIYRTEDGGENWQHLGLAETHHIGRIVLHPTRPEVAYVAALGHLYSANEERGLYRTDDAGASWRKVLYINADVGVVDVVVDPRDGDVIYAATYERRRRAWDFDGAGPGSGIWRSVDGGLNWDRCTGLPEGEIGRIGLALFPGDPDTIFASISDQNLMEVAPTHDPDVALVTRFRGGELSVQRVADGSGAKEIGLRPRDVLVRLGDVDLGSGWAWVAALESLEERGEDAEAELVWLRKGKTMRAQVTRDDLERVASVEDRMRPVGGQIFRSDDRGVSWRQVNEKPIGGSPAYYYGQIRVDPVDSQNLYLLSVQAYASEDGGRTWRRDFGRTLHSDHHAVEVDPNNPQRIVLANDGGLAISHDRGAHWDLLTNLPIAQFYAIGVDNSRPYRMYGGTQDNGTWGGPSRSPVGGSVLPQDWEKVGGGDGFYAQIDAMDPSTVYGESQFGFLYRRDRKSGRTAYIRPPRAAEGEAAHRYNWSSPILISSHNSRIVYFGGNRLFKSLDRGDNWSQVSEDLTTANPDKIAGNVPHCTLTTIAESPLDPNLLLVGTDDGLVQRSLDGGLTWNSLAGRFPDLPTGLWVSRVVLSAVERERAYVTFTGYREDNFRPYVYGSDDMGETWRAIHGELPHEPVNVILEDPANGDVLYLGTDLGIWASLDRGANWTSLGAGLPTIAVHDLLVQARDRELVIGTHGRGFWILDVSGLDELTEEARSAAAHLCSIPEFTMWRRTRSSSGWGGHRHWSPDNGPSGIRITYHLAEKVDKDALGLRILNAAGKVLAEPQLKYSAGLHRVHWNPAGRRRAGVSAGTYRVELELNGHIETRSFKVLSDPRDL